MKKILEEFIPFEHKNLEYINGSLNLARTQRQSESFDSLMASAVIYTNLVEYLTRNLLENFQFMMHLISYRVFGGIFFIREKNRSSKKEPKMLGQIINSLEDFEFPDKIGFINLVKKFSQTRNDIFHKLLNKSEKEIQYEELGKQLAELHSMAEEVLDKYNAITSGIINTWNAAVRPQAPPSQLNLENQDK